MESVSQVEPRTPLSTLGGNADSVVLIAIDNGTIRNWEQYGLNLANGTMIEDLTVANNGSVGLAANYGNIIAKLALIL